MSSSHSENIRAETSYPAVIGKVIADLRKKNKLDQSELARAVGVNQPTWSRIENGTSAFTVAQLRKAAAELGTTSAEISASAYLAVAGLERRGIRVHADMVHPSSLNKGNIFALLGGAALGSMVTAVLMSDKGEDKNKPS